MPYTIPSDAHNSGDSGHTTDHNNIADILTLGAAVNVKNTAYAGGAKGDGIADDTAAIAAAVTAAAAAGRPVVIPAGTYKITSTMDWRIKGLRVFGEGKQNTIISQATANTQIVQFAGAHQHISGLQFAYPAQQPSTSTAAIGCSFGEDGTVGSSFQSVYENLYIVQAQTGLAVDPAVASVGGLFSCSLHNIHIAGYSQSAISLIASNGTGANCTGSHFTNIYCHNNFPGTDQTAAGRAVNIQGFDDLEITQLNIEHAQQFNGDCLAFTSCGTVSVRGLHIEHVEMSGNPGFGWLFANACGMVLVNGMSVRFPALTGTSYNSVIRLAGAGTAVRLKGYNSPSDGGISTAHPWVDWGTSTSSAVFIDDVAAAQVTANSVNYVAANNPELQFGGTTPSYFGVPPNQAVAETISRRQATTVQSALTSGTLYVTALHMNQGAVVSNITMVTNTTAKLGGTHGWYVLLDSAMKVLAVTADKTDAATTWGAASTAYTIAVTAPIVTAYDGLYYVGIMVAATTMPTLSGAGGPGPAGGINNTAPVMAGTSSTAQTTPPAVGATMTAITASGGYQFYAYLT